MTGGPAPLLSSDLEYQVASDQGFVGGARTSTDGSSAFYAVFAPPSSGYVDNSGLYKRDLATNQETLLVPLPGYSNTSFPNGTFSGDGERYAGFTANGLLVIDTTNGAQHTIDPSSGNSFLLWSDDHRYLYFATSGFYRYDTSTGTEQSAAPTVDGQPPNGPINGDVAISADGNRVTFSSSATNLTINPTNGATRVFVHDFTTGQTLVLPQAPGQAASYFDRHPIISADGSTVAYEAMTQSNGATQVAADTVANGSVTLVSAPPSGSPTDGSSTLAAISGDGNTVLFNSTATDLVPGTTVSPTPTDPGLGYEYQLYARTVSAGQTLLLTRSANAAQSANSGGSNATIDRSGKTVAFLSQATDLVSNYQVSGQNAVDQVYTYDLTTNNITFASAQPAGSSTAPRVPSYSPVVSPSGNHVIYITTRSYSPTSLTPWLVTVNGAPTAPPPPPPCPTGVTHLSSGEPWAVAAMATTINGRVCAGYWVVTRTGGVTSIGAAPWLGDSSGHMLNAPMIGIAATPAGGGYYLLGADGGIFTFGDAVFQGSTGSLRLNAPVVAMAVTPNGGGYWLTASDGGIFTFGDAPFYGSTGGQHLNKPIVGMSADSHTGGYWLVASDGGIFTFNTPFYGSMGGQHLNQPVVGMSPQPDGGGYRLVAADGGVFDFGDAIYYGSLPGQGVQNPQVTTMASSIDGNGYYLIDGSGTVWAFGDAPYLGNA